MTCVAELRSAPAGPFALLSRVGQTAPNSATRCATLQAAINVATVPDPDHQNNQPNILDGVDDPIVSGAETKQVRLTLQFLHPWRTWIGCQPVDALFDSLLLMAGKLCQLAERGRQDRNRV